MLTSETSNHQLSLLPVYGVQDGHAKTSVPLTRKEKVCQEIVADSSMSLWHLSAEQGTAFETVIDKLEESGYLGGWFSCNATSAGLPHYRERIFIIASYRSNRAYNFFANCGELHGDFTKGTASREKNRSNIRDVIERNTPLVVQRRGGFGYTSANSISPTLRAQTGNHQGGHSDRPILCGQKLDLERVRETNGISPRLDGRRGRLIGNAVVPQIAEWIGKKILVIDEFFI